MSEEAETTQEQTAEEGLPEEGLHEEGLHPVIIETLDVFKAEGVTIETTDPEYKALTAILKDPNGNIHKYRKELYKQIEAKRQRLTEAQAKITGREYLNRAHTPAQALKPQAPAEKISGRDYLQRAHKRE
jgi:uncharacterized protein YdbL (DUF1318 family)